MGERQGEDNEPPKEEDRRRRPRGPKYPPVEPPPPTALSKLTPYEQKRLATLVKKYGAGVVAEAAKTVGPSHGPGRPKRGQLPRFEGIALAQFFDELIGEHRTAGRRFPERDALHELFEFTHPSRRDDPAAFKRFVSTTKRKIPQSRRDLKAAIERAGAIADYRTPRKTRAK
ncbi:MAG: hypothetical protein U1E81_13745 [Xanthobacteraceae bacterium]